MSVEGRIHFIPFVSFGNFGADKYKKRQKNVQSTLKQMFELARFQGNECKAFRQNISPQARRHLWRLCMYSFKSVKNKNLFL